MQTMLLFFFGREDLLTYKNQQNMLHNYIHMYNMTIQYNNKKDDSIV